ncbi:MAG: hypothetical protein OT477_10660 [Chloroflexi bacterium]|nr:hypothetical protein [Chloroflexota bacterium]
MQTLHNPPVLQAWQTAVQEETRTRPWLTSFLLHQSPHLFTRFADYYRQLLAAPRKVRRQLGAGLATAALLLALSSSPAHAATITVTPNSSGIANNGRCSLVEAIINANNNAATHTDCAAGSGADTIVLAGNTYTYTATFGTYTALPDITTNITIEANGATILRDNSAPNMRLIRVSAAGTLTLNNATMTGGNTILASGAGLSNLGTTTLNNSTITGNTTNGRGGGIFNSGTLVLTNSTISGNTSNNLGGGIYDYTGITTLTNSTITGNSTTTSGGGIYNRASIISLLHTIISGNLSPAGSEAARNTSLAGTILTLNHNVLGHSGLTNAQAFSGFTPSGTDITATSDGTTPTTLASILNTTLADNGGPTLTHALVSGSPAIDIISSGGAGCILNTSTDQRGGVRGSGANRGDGACDAGAYEFNSNQIPTAVTNLLTQTTSHPPTSILALLATLLAAFSGVRLWRRR